MTKPHTSSIQGRMADSSKPDKPTEPVATKSVTYTLVGGGKKTIEYDPNAPCWYCELPVGSASMGGTVVCPSCDCGRHRDGRQWTLEEANQFYANFRRHQEAVTTAASPDRKPTRRQK